MDMIMEKPVVFVVDDDESPPVKRKSRQLKTKGENYDTQVKP
jgi:hypothetical protein